MGKSDLKKAKPMDDAIDDFVSWWKKVQKKQETNPPHVTPFFTKKDVRTRMAAVSGEIEKLRKPKKEKEKVDTTDWNLEKVEAEFKRIDAGKAAAIKEGDYEKAANLKKERKHFESIAQALKEKPEL
jgi:TolA-binding protein